MVTISTVALPTAPDTVCVKITRKRVPDGAPNDKGAIVDEILLSVTDWNALMAITTDDIVGYDEVTVNELNP